MNASPRSGHSTPIRVWLLGAAALLALAACEEDVTAVAPSGRPFTLYGVVSPQLDSQWVRVFPVEEFLEPARPEPLDARFTSTDRGTGEERLWQDSLIREADGQYAHVFWAPFRAEYGHTYRLEVRRSDGALTFVDAAVPPRTEIVPQDPQIDPTRAVLPVLVRGGAPHLLKIEAEYFVDFKSSGVGERRSDRVAFAYDGRQTPGAQGWIVPLDLAGDFRTIRETLIERTRQPLDPVFGVALLNLTLRLIVANEAWNPPGGLFDPEVLVQPGAMENVENGFGFVGTGYRLQNVWIPPDTLARAAGFRIRTE